MFRSARRNLLTILIFLGAVWGRQAVARADHYEPGDAPTCNISCDKSSPLASGGTAALSIANWLDNDLLVSNEASAVIVPDGMGAVEWEVLSGPATLSANSGSPVNLMAGAPDNDEIVTVQATVSDSGTKFHDAPLVKTFLITVKATRILNLQMQDGSINRRNVDGGTIYVANGSSRTFIANPDPANAQWPAGKPAWDLDGTPLGNGATQEVTFNGNGTKRLTATCGNSKFVTVVVSDFAGKLTPFDDFSPARSHLRLGVEERAKLEVDFGTGMDLNTLGPLTWTRTAGNSVTLNSANPEAGTASITAGDNPGDTLFTLTDNSGNSAQLTVSVTPPTATRMTRVNQNMVFHMDVGIPSAGIALYYFLEPKDVSFRYVTFGEDTCQPEGIVGCFLAHPPDNHPQNTFGPISDGSITDGCRVQGMDHAAFGFPWAWGNGGAFTWMIPTQWIDQFQQRHDIDKARHTSIIFPNGDAEQDKKDQWGGAEIGAVYSPDN